MNKNIKKIPFKRISIDFDRVIHKYSKGFLDGKIYDEPVKGAVEAIRRLQEAGFEVVILTAKSNIKERNSDIRQWLKQNGINKVKVSHTKFPAIAYIDDRAIRFEGNWRSILSYFL